MTVQGVYAEDIEQWKRRAAGRWLEIDPRDHLGESAAAAIPRSVPSMVRHEGREMRTDICRTRRRAEMIYGTIAQTVMRDSRWCMATGIGSGSTEFIAAPVTERSLFKREVGGSIQPRPSPNETEVKS